MDPDQARRNDRPLRPGISLGFGVAGKHCQIIGKIYCFIVQPNGPIFKVAGTEGKVGGCFCRLPALNENTGVGPDLDPNCLTLMVLLKNFSFDKKLILTKFNRQHKNEKIFTAGKELIGL